MKYPYGVAVFVPWMDAEGNRSHSRFTFKGFVDRRRVRRQIRKAFSKIGVKAPKNYIDRYIRLRSFPLDKYFVDTATDNQ